MKKVEFDGVRYIFGNQSIENDYSELQIHEIVFVVDYLCDIFESQYSVLDMVARNQILGHCVRRMSENVNTIEELMKCFEIAVGGYR